MCEWLSCREWCDVRLQCGGRWFPAHRAVLASVSDFLRQILLSCHTEETPTSILLPDFDLEALSSVLYYIYNGEVVIQKEKKKTFMEIIQAMRIFIDDQYLSNLCKNECSNSLFCKRKVPSNAKIFTLGDNHNGPYIALKKNEHTLEVVFAKNCHNNLDVQDKQIKSNSQDMNKSCFGDICATSGDRQRSSFLRDLFIETYPQNGNANGRTPGVPAIPNECYRGAASVLLTNANGKHLAAVDQLSEMQRTSGTYQWRTTSYVPNSQFGVPTSLSVNEDSSLINLAKLSQSKNYDVNYTASLNSKLLTPNNCYVPKDYFGIGWVDEFSKSIKQPPLLRLTAHPVSELHKTRPNSSPVSNQVTNSLVRHGLMPKGAILNQVMKSPWCPRQPNNFRPFRRKVQNKPDLPQDVANDNTVNDNNNNVQSFERPEITERMTSPNKTAESLCLKPDASDYKCSICNQIFRNPESLAVHSRRHSSSTRYSCTECSKSFSQLRNFKYHMSIHRGTREFAATCTVCGKYFNDRGYLSSHMKIHRNRKEYKCSQCPKSFNQRVAYNMHVRIHTGVKPHVCGECGKAFSRKMLLKQHQRTHSGERPYACPHCDKRFADRSNMTLHLRLHTGIKPFSCTLCPKSFTKKHHLKSHLNFHTGAKPYSCPRCKLAFTQSSNMRTHYKKCKAPDPNSIAETSMNELNY